MSGLFSGLELGKRALTTHQLWLNTIGHNIANVNTPGYSRQRVITATSDPYEHAVGPVGTGIKAVNISHIRDLFLNQQYRQENELLGRWNTMDKTLTQIEAIFAEPSDDSLGGMINDFWDSWSDLANNPENSGRRNSLKEKTNVLTTGFHRIYSQLVDLKNNVDDEVALTIKNVNSLADEIALLNLQISRFELGDKNANDLRDKRDLLVDELSEYVNVNVIEKDNGLATVYIGSLAIVEGTSSFNLDTYKSGAGTATTNQIVWKGTTKSIKILDGKIKGALELRDNIIPEYLQALDDMAEALVTNVNALHQTGYGLNGTTTGLDFFNSTRISAADISLSGEIDNNINNIAASQSGEVGDNTNALAISDLRSSLMLSRNTSTISEFYQSLIGKIGVDTSKARNLKENYELLVGQLENSRQSVQGVSLDEEMAQMIKYQHAFDAAARIITTMDQALETVISGMGVVGR